MRNDIKSLDLKDRTENIKRQKRKTKSARIDFDFKITFDSVKKSTCALKKLSLKPSLVRRS